MLGGPSFLPDGLVRYGYAACWVKFWNGKEFCRCRRPKGHKGKHLG